MQPPISWLKESDPYGCQSCKECGLLQGKWLFTNMGMGKGIQHVLQCWVMVKWDSQERDTA